MASVASYSGSLFLLFVITVVSVRHTVSDQTLESDSQILSEQWSGVGLEGREEFVSTASTASYQDDDVSNGTEDLGEKETERRSLLPRYRQTLLLYHLKRSTHAPVCILFSKKDADADLEEKVSKLWSKISPYMFFKTWKLGVYMYDVASGPLKGFTSPDHIPSLRCYVGTAEPEDYSGKPSLQRLLQWFKMLGHKYRNRITEADLDSLKKAVSDESKLTILAFPGEEQHFEIEWMLLEFKSSHPNSLQLFVVHPGSVNESSLQHKFSIKIEPTILALKIGDQRLRVLQRFEEPLASRRFVEPFIMSQTSSAMTLTVNNFQQEVFSGGATPILVCFYTHWAEGVVPYLHAFLESVKLFREHGAKLRFGIVDVEVQQDIVPRWVNAPLIEGMPFSILFWRKPGLDKGKILHQIALPEGANTPMAIGSFLQEQNVTLGSIDGGPFHYPTWVASSYDMEVSMGESSLIAPTCITAVNTSLEGVADIWSEGPPTNKKIDRTGPDSTTNRADADSKATSLTKDVFIQREHHMSRIGSIERLTDASWSTIIEKSHAGMKPEDLQELMNIHKTSRKKDVPQTNLVFFIQDGCGSCRRQQPMFERVAKAVKFVGELLSSHRVGARIRDPERRPSMTLMKL